MSTTFDVIWIDKINFEKKKKLLRRDNLPLHVKNLLDGYVAEHTI